jgi:hypothetical protein
MRGLLQHLAKPALLLASANQILCCAANAQPAAKPAQKETPALVEKPMQVDIVRSAKPGCEPNCPEWIAAQGRIDSSTPAAFKRALNKLGKRKLPVLIYSSGGGVSEGYEIGRLIRAKGLDVVVTKTAYKTCDLPAAECRQLKAQGVILAMPEAELTFCASSCVFVLAGGVRRYVGPRTLVGVHQFSSYQTLTKVQRTYRVETRYRDGVPVERQKILVDERKIRSTTKKTETEISSYDEAKAYFNGMGVGDGIMPLLVSVTNDKIRWLKPGELKSTGIATDFETGDTLILGAAVAPPSVEAPARVVPTLTPPMAGGGSPSLPTMTVEEMCALKGSTRPAICEPLPESSPGVR